MVKEIVRFKKNGKIFVQRIHKSDIPYVESMGYKVVNDYHKKKKRKTSNSYGFEIPKFRVPKF